MKERLTGAIILVVLVVALVPELLSGPKPAPAPKLLTTEDGAPIRSVRIDLAEPAAESPASADVATHTVPAPPSAPPPSPALPAAAAVPTPTPAPAPAPAPAPSSSPAPSPAPASAQPRGPSPVAVALARTAPPASPPPAADGESFVVQVGTFSSRANATRLAQQLSEKGLSARVLPFKGGATELYRVRVGPAGDRAAAVTLLARVKAAGSGGTVVPNLSQAAARP